MNNEHHERARMLLAAARVEGLKAAERAWLGSHLDACGDCRVYAESLDRAVAVVRSFQAPVDPALMEATRRRLHLRAREIREHEARMRALWMACGLSWVLGVLTAPLLWWGLEWIGHRFLVPQPVWVTAFLFSWIVPAAVVAAALAWRQSRAADQNGYASIPPRQPD
jgi:anti-sigma factor RsiW